MYKAWERLRKFLCACESPNFKITSLGQNLSDKNVNKHPKLIYDTWVSTHIIIGQVIVTQLYSCSMKNLLSGYEKNCTTFVVNIWYLIYIKSNQENRDKNKAI